MRFPILSMFNRLRRVRIENHPYTGRNADSIALNQPFFRYRRPAAKALINTSTNRMPPMTANKPPMPITPMAALA